MIKIHASKQGFLEIQMEGEITRKQLVDFEPDLFDALKEEKNNILIDLTKFKDATTGALLEDMALQVRFHTRFNKIAVLDVPAAYTTYLEMSKKFMERKATIKIFKKWCKNKKKGSIIFRNNGTIIY